MGARIVEDAGVSLRSAVCHELLRHGSQLRGRYECVMELVRAGTSTRADMSAAGVSAARSAMAGGALARCSGAVAFRFAVRNRRVRLFMCLARAATLLLRNRRLHTDGNNEQHYELAQPESLATGEGKIKTLHICMNLAGYCTKTK